MAAAMMAFLVFVIVAVAAFALGSLADQRNAQARLIRERLADERKTPERNPEEELALLRDEQLSRIPALDTLLRRSERVSNIQKMLAQAGMDVRAGNFLGLCGDRAREERRPRASESRFRGLRCWSALSCRTRWSPTGGTSGSRNSRSFFRRRSTPWPGRCAPATPLPRRWR